MEQLMSPQLQVFNAVYAIAERLGYDAYDYLPAADAQLPFVYVGEQFDNDLRTKTSIYGRVQQRVHIYHSYKKRREITTMIDNLKREFRNLKRTKNFYVTVKNINGQIITDNSTAEPLLHGIIEVEFQFH